MDSLEVFYRIRDWLTEQEICFREMEHEPTYTSEESAAARGEELKVGGKALLLKVGGRMNLFVLPADCRVDSAAIRDRLLVRKTRFATPEELKELTGLVPGSVPPFGEPILPFDLYLDELVTENDRIAFNAGSLRHSLILSMKDYLKVAQPKKIFHFAIR